MAVELASRRGLRPDGVVEGVDLAVAGEVRLAVVLAVADAPDAVGEVLLYFLPLLIVAALLRHLDVLVDDELQARKRRKLRDALGTASGKLLLATHWVFGLPEPQVQKLLWGAISIAERSRPVATSFCMWSGGTPFFHTDDLTRRKLGVR